MGNGRTGPSFGIGSIQGNAVGQTAVEEYDATKRMGKHFDVPEAEEGKDGKRRGSSVVRATNLAKPTPAKAGQVGQEATAQATQTTQATHTGTIIGSFSEDDAVEAEIITPMRRACQDAAKGFAGLVASEIVETVEKALK